MRKSVITMNIIFIDFMALLRYIFICWLKNPAGFKEDFWSLFLYLWTAPVAVIFHFVWGMLPGKSSYFLSHLKFLVASINVAKSR